MGGGGVWEARGGVKSLIRLFGLAMCPRSA